MPKRTGTISLAIIIFLSAIPAITGNAQESRQQPAEQAQAPAQVPATAPDYLQRGIMDLTEGNYEEAVEDFTKARERDPDSALVSYYLGSAYKKAQDYPNAVKHLKEAVSNRSAVKAAILELADTYYQLEKMEEAFLTIQFAEKDNVEPAQTAFLKGLILMKTDKYDEAVDSLQKAKAIDPTLAASADYQIAFARFQQGRLVEARDLFRELVVRDPNADIANFANQYAEAISRKLWEDRPLRITGALSYLYDSNVMLKPADSSVAAGISGESDTSTVATLRAEYMPRLTDPYGMKLQYSFYLNAHSDLTAFDVQSHTIAAVPSYKLGQSTASLLMSYNDTRVNNKAYLKAQTLSPLYTFAPGANQFAQASIKYERKDYQQPPAFPDENRDGTDLGLGFSWFYLFAGNRGFVNARYELNQENTSGNNWSYMGNKIGVTVLQPVMDRLRITGGVEAYFQSFDNVNPLFNKKREDKTYALSAQAVYSLSRTFDLQLQFAHVKGASSILVYDYDRNMISAGVEAKF